MEGDGEENENVYGRRRGHSERPVIYGPGPAKGAVSCSHTVVPGKPRSNFEAPQHP